MIKVTASKGWEKTRRFLEANKKMQLEDILKSYGQLGVNALAAATPMNTGLAAQSWYFETESSNGRSTIRWCNSDLENGFPVVIMLQYGHGTRNGGYVMGQDFINPALRPVFDQIAKRVREAVDTA